jgi:pimeloyl-ACP methyl ester carboxylesterase
MGLLCVGSAALGQFSPADKPAFLQSYSNASRARFGFITVPESRSNPSDTRTIRLAVIIIPAQSINPAPDPVFYIVGGPGGSATIASDWFPVFDQLNLERDIVFLDPRGAGFSDPCLFMRQGGATIGAFVNQNRAYFSGQGIDVSEYNTTEIAQDYEAARVALGYGQINIFASSYGTFVAQEILRRFPSSLRSAILEGNMPATDSFIPGVLAQEKHGIDALLMDVQRDSAARQAFPQFRERFYALIQKLNASPVKLRLRTFDTHRLKGVKIDGSEFLSTVSEMLQRTETMRLIPLMVQQLERGDYGSLVSTFFAPSEDLNIENPFGMYLSVLGTDFASQGYVSATSRAIKRVHDPVLQKTDGPNILQVAELASVWGVPYNPGTTRTLPQSNVPTLLLNGMMDAQTSVTGGATIAASLSNATNLVYPRCGHAVGLDKGPAMDAAMAFIENPAQRPALHIGSLSRNHFYITFLPGTRSRGPSDWRRHLVDLPVLRAFQSEESAE